MNRLSARALHCWSSSWIRRLLAPSQDREKTFRPCWSLPERASAWAGTPGRGREGPLDRTRSVGRPTARLPVRDGLLRGSTRKDFVPSLHACSRGSKGWQVSSCGIGAGVRCRFRRRIAAGRPPRRAQWPDPVDFTRKDMGSATHSHVLGVVLDDQDPLAAIEKAEALARPRPGLLEGSEPFSTSGHQGTASSSVWRPFTNVFGTQPPSYACVRR